MGLIIHNAIVVTGWQEAAVKEARDKAQELGLDASGVVCSKVNGYCSFFVAPDGSKAGWPEAEDAEANREVLIDWMNAQYANYQYYDWSYVRFGGDFPEDATLRSHNTPQHDEIKQKETKIC